MEEKKINISWKWSGDFYALEGFEILANNYNQDINNNYSNIYFKYFYPIDKNKLLENLIQDLDQETSIKKILIDFQKLNNNLNIPNVTINNPNNWIIDTQGRLQNNDINDNQMTYIEFTFNNYNISKYKYYIVKIIYDIDSEAYYDFFRCEIYTSSNSKYEIFKDSGTKTNRVLLSSPTLISYQPLKLCLKYTKDGTISKGTDSVYIKQIEILLAENQDDLTNNAVVGKEILYTKLFNTTLDVTDYLQNDNYDLWIRPLYLNKNGSWKRLRDGKVINIIDEPVINENNKPYKHMIYNFDITKINGGTIQTGTITFDKLKGNTLKLGGLNGRNGELQVVDNNGKTIITMNNNGIIIDSGSLILKNKNNETLIDSEGIKVEHLIIDKELYIIGGNNKTLLLNKNAQNENIIKMDEYGMHVYDYNEKEIVTIDNNGIKIFDGKLTILNKDNITIIDENGINASTIKTGNLIMGGKEYYNSQILFYNNNDKLFQIINKNGIFIYDGTGNIEENNLRLSINSEGLNIFRYNNGKREMFLSSANGINAENIIVNNLIINPFTTEGFQGIKFLDENENKRMTINKDGIIVYNNNGQENIIFNTEGLIINSGALKIKKKIADNVYQDVILFNEYGLALEALSSNNENPIIKLFPQDYDEFGHPIDYCSLDATANYEQGRGEAIRLKWDRKNYIYIGENNFTIYLEDETGDSNPVFTINSNGMYYKNQNLLPLFPMNYIPFTEEPLIFRVQGR